MLSGFQLPNGYFNQKYGIQSSRRYTNPLFSAKSQEKPVELWASNHRSGDGHRWGAGCRIMTVKLCDQLVDAGQRLGWYFIGAMWCPHFHLPIIWTCTCRMVWASSLWSSRGQQKI